VSERLKNPERKLLHARLVRSVTEMEGALDA
jgi:hypothetical protein